MLKYFAQVPAIPSVANEYPLAGICTEGQEVIPIPFAPDSTMFLG